MYVRVSVEKMNCYSTDSRALCVSVDGTRRILNGLDWRTTAEDIVQRLRPRSGRQILVESWRGCVRRVEKDEHICQLMEEWGEEARNVQLVLMSSHSLPGYRLANRGVNKTQIYRAQKHGKVASNKKRCLSRLTTPKRNIMRDVARLIGRAEAAKERLSAAQELYTLTDNTLLEVNTFNTENIGAPFSRFSPQSPTLDLSPSEEEEWVALQEQLAEEEQEMRELEQRKRELQEKIDTQSCEISKLKHRKAEWQRKVCITILK